MLSSLCPVADRNPAQIWRLAKQMTVDHVGRAGKIGEPFSGFVTLQGKQLWNPLAGCFVV